MMYNTGDLGRLRPDGKFDHLGRMDDQVKVKVSVTIRPLNLNASLFMEDLLSDRDSASSSTV